MRHDGRKKDDLRKITIKRKYTRVTPGSVLIAAGGTRVLCTASVEEDVPPWMAGKGKGWVTAEYNMLPGSTSPRKRRDRGGKIFMVIEIEDHAAINHTHAHCRHAVDKWQRIPLATNATERIDQCNERARNAGRSRSTIGLNHITIDRNHPLAERFQIDDRP